MIEKRRNDLLVMLLGLLKYTVKPKIPIPAIVIPTDNKSKFFIKSIEFYSSQKIVVL